MSVSPISSDTADLVAGSDHALSPISSGFADESSLVAVGSVGYGATDSSTSRAVAGVGYDYADGAPVRAVGTVGYGATDGSSSRDVGPVGYGLADLKPDHAISPVMCGEAQLIPLIENLVALAISPKLVRLTWTLNASSFTSMRVVRRPYGMGQAGWGTIANINPASTNYDDTAVWASQGFDYQVVGYFGGNAYPSAIVSVVTPAYPPGGSLPEVEKYDFPNVFIIEEDED